MVIDKAAIRSVISNENSILWREQIGESYLSDILGHWHGEAEALVFVQSAKEVSALLQYANAQGIPVTPRGAGTGLAGGAVPSQGGIILDFSRMNHILELDKRTMTVTTEPGVLLSDLQAFVEANGLFYPPDPGEKASTIGGNISTNAGGMRAVKYGVTRDYVMGLEIVLADGTILSVGGKNAKDATGLSLVQLLIGSEGTLAAITRCTLRLLPLPQASVSAIVAFDDLDGGIESVLYFLQSGIRFTAVEFMERRITALGERYLGARYPYPEAGSYLLLTIDGDPQEVESQLTRLERLARDRHALGCMLLRSEQERKSAWALRDCLAKAVTALSAEWEPVDVVVPISRTADFVRFVNRLEETTGMTMYSCGHAGDGNVHLWVLRGDREEEVWRRELRDNMERIYAAAAAMGGVVSGEHGIGVAKRRYLFQNMPRANIDMMNQIKRALDPRHILNDDKSYVK